MDSLVALASDFYWEQDREGRFARIVRTGGTSLGPSDIEIALGKQPWQIATLSPASGSWDDLRDALARRRAFRDTQWRWERRSGDACWFSVTGEPLFDARGMFNGYRGILRDITAQWREEEDFQRFRSAMDVSGDSIYVIDRETMRFVEINETACKVSGFTRDELLTMGPQDLLMVDRTAIEADYEQVIAAGRRGTITESQGRSKSGAAFIYELQRRAFRFGGRWTIVTIARDITRRRSAEDAAQRFSRMYAAISAINEAILLSQTPEDLYQRVCEAAVSGGHVVSASVLTPEPGSDWAKIIAVAGQSADAVRRLRTSFSENLPEGHGLVGPAFRSGTPSICNDHATDERMRPWRHVTEGPIAAGAAVPLMRNGVATGVFLLYSREKNVFDEEVVQLLVRMARNVAYALDNFDREIEKRRAVEALKASEEKYRGILENMSDGYFELDMKGSYTFVNDAMCRMHGCSREEVLKLNYRDFLDPETAARAFEVYNRIYRTGLPADMTEYVVHGSDGGERITETAVQLIRNSAGQPCGFRGVTRDITARRAAEEALRSSEEKYRSILENIEEAYYEVDLAGTLVLCNEAFTRMFGYRMDEMIGISYRRFHRADAIPYVYAHFNEVFRTGAAKTGIDWPIAHKDGNVVTCEGSIHLIRCREGKPCGFRGMLRDVTARRRMENALRESEERFRDLTRLSSDWYWEQDAQYRFVQVTGDVLAKTGIPVAEYLGRTLWEMPFDSLSEEQWQEHRAQLAAGQAFYELVVRTAPGEGAPRYIRISGLPVRDAKGKLTGYRGTGKDITERKIAEERIRHLASHDILTGLPNRMMFSQVLGYTLQQARRYERRFAVMFIDLDHFKAINDRFGHEAGDTLLKEVAQRLTHSVRSSDFVARLAGDEFVVLVQEAGESSVLGAIARKIVHAVRAPLALGGESLAVTASVGICVFPDDGTDEEALMRHADAAMYRVKHDSKDDFRFFDSGSPSA